MHQSIAIERRTCKHLRAYRGDALETERVGVAGPAVRAPRPPRAPGAADDDAEAGEEGVEPPLLLAHKWEMDVDLTGWWMSEKLDGVRAYWDGERFISRLGNPFHVPDWFKSGLPKTPLDGELWGGRKRFQRTVGIVKRQDKSDAWKEIRYVVFDAPGEKSPFESRMEHCEKVLRGHEWASVHAQEVCRGEPHLREQLAFVESLGGEGLMMRKPGSLYEAGRSATLLKVKSFFDAEARVLEHVPGTGKHKGRLGSLLVELPDGTRFNVGTGFSDKEREAPPALGAIITFRYQELSDGGVPRFPSYVGERHDVRWTGSTKTVSVAVPAGAARPAPQAVQAPKPAPAPSAAAAEPPARFRRFEWIEGDTRMFWEIERDGDRHRVRYGSFEQKVKRFASDEEAERALEERIREKLDQGFVETE
ncbi:MAG: DNA ligase [Polyangiaceae bacterium]